MSEDLSDLRKKIDDIDNTIIDLLKKRMNIVKEVGKRKSSSNTGNLSFIRAGREATMLRDLTQKIEGVFPPAAIATIWRMIISSSLSVEQNMTITAYVSDSDNTCFWRAREYYGSFIDITTDTSTNNIIKNVESGKISVGILPLVDKSEAPWWVRPKEEKNDIFVFARIPFIERKNQLLSPALAIANIATEATKDDISILAIHCNDGKEHIQSMLEIQNCKITWLANKNNNFLIEVDIFLSSDDIKLKAIKESLGDNNVRLLGSYAKPISL